MVYFINAWCILHYIEGLQVWSWTNQFNDANKFVNMLPYLDNYPLISMVDDGELNFYWKYDDVRIDLGFYGNGVYSYYAQKGTHDYFGDDIAIDNIPESLLWLLTGCKQVKYIDNDGDSISLEVNKTYPVLPDFDANKHNLVRVID